MAGSVPPRTTVAERLGDVFDPAPPPDGRKPRWRRARDKAVERYRHRRRTPPRFWLVVAAVVALVAATDLFLVTRPETPPALTTRDVQALTAKQLDERATADAARPSDATVAYQAIQPSLVLITTQQPADSAAGRGAGQGTGAGVIVNADGTVLTALHVVEGATTIKVTYADGTSSDATVAKAQPESDIATLAPADLPETVVPAVLGGGVVVGAPVFAVGHPLGLTDSLSAGVVSALGRSVRVEGGRTLKDLIQVDTAVNPGNSGGPLLNRAGQVVGIVTGLANPSDESSFIGIGFAVPIATAGGAAGGPPQ